MEKASSSADALRQKIAETEKQLAELKSQLASIPAASEVDGIVDATENSHARKWPLSQEEYTRYGRQMIVPSIGIEGEKLFWWCATIANADKL